MELYKKHRPTELSDVIGAEDTVKTLQNMIERKKVPHTILFHGPSGCGKTTLARILKTELDCDDIDFRELNCSDFRGIDTVREITRNMRLAPTGGNCRIWLLDEVHQLSKDGQNAALKILEDTPSHVYFFLCTTDPQKLLKTIRTRCCEFPVRLLTEKEISKLMKSIIKEESLDVSEEAIEEILDKANGSARTALVLLDKIANLTEEEQAEAVKVAVESEKETIELCRALYQKADWRKITTLLNGIVAEPETIRYAVLMYARAILLKKRDSHAFHMITCFEDNFYDSKQAGLVRACYEVICG